MVPIRKKGKFEQPRVPVQQTSAAEAPEAAVAAESIQPRKAPKPAKPRKPIGPWLKHAAIGAALIAAAVVGGLYFYGMQLQSQNTIFPNVWLGGIPVGGMTATEALNALTEAANTPETAASLQVELPDQTLIFTPEVSRTFDDPNDAVVRAMNYGKDVNPIRAIRLYRSEERADVPLSATVNLDTDYIRSVIDQAAEKVGTELEHSSIEYMEERQELVVHTGTPSVKLDADALYDAVCQAYADGNTETLQWGYTQQLPEPIDLVRYHGSLSAEPSDAYYDAETRTIVADVPGLSFDLAKADEKLSEAGYGETFTVALEEVPAELTAEMLDQQMFGYKLEGRTSPYRSSQESRTINLDLACKAINGLILNPGDVFSFNEVLGERTAEKGYLPAPVFGDGGMSEGGGICQVASTIFYTVLYADLETVERKEHSYPVDYVPKGMDAAIYWDEGQDYKFRNNKQNPIRIEAFLDGTHVNINFWGVKENDNYVVMTSEIFEKWIDPDEEIINPDKPAGYRQQVQWAAYGMKINAFQSVFNGENELIRTQRYYTYHYSLCNRWEVSPDMATGLGSGGGGAAAPSTPTDPSVPDGSGETDVPLFPFEDPLGG